MIKRTVAKLVNVAAAVALCAEAALPLPLLAQTTADQAPAQSNSKVLKGGVTYLVPHGTSIKLKLATVPTNGMRLLDRDLDGNLLPAKVGQEITAKTTEDIYVDDSKVIPEGTIFHGQVTAVAPPRRVRRPGSLSLSFDEIITPDGKHFAFKAEADNKKESTAGTKAHGFGIIAAHAAGGAIVGTLVAYQLFGLHNTIACKGINLAGGAAGGALLATAFAIMKKGPKAVLEPGDDLNMQIDRDLLMPAAVEPTVKREVKSLAGLDVDVQRAKMKADGLGGRELIVDCSIYNDSDRPLNSLDLFVEDTNGNRTPVSAGADTDTDFLFTIDPHTMRKVQLHFQVEYPKLKRQLVWLDRNSRQVCYRQKLPDK